MTIDYCIQIGDSLNKKNEILIKDIISSTFSTIDKVYNNWNPDSEVSKLNGSQAHQNIALSKELLSFIKNVGAIVELTEGRFDPTVEPLQKLWKRSLNQGTLPPLADLEKIREAIGWDKVHVHENFISKEHPLVALDFSGVAKGYAVDLLVENLANAGFKKIYVEWGGEIRVFGMHPEGRPWKIGMEGTSCIELEDGAIATSGTYFQNWNIDSVNYTHIMDPRTQMPLQNAKISSVSVVAPTCMQADALATTLMLFESKEEAAKWALQNNIEAYIW